MLNSNIFSSLKTNAEKQPDKIAINYNDDKINYINLYKEVISLSNELINKGVKKGDFVCVNMENSIEMIISILSILSCRAIVVPLSSDLPKERVLKIINDNQPKLILASNYTYDLKNYTTITTLLVKRNIYVDYKEIDFLYEGIDEDLAYCIYTSGTTGNPKGVLLTYEGIFNHINSKIEIINLISSYNYCLSFNIGFVASIWQILTPIFLGASLYLYKNDLMKNIYGFISQLSDDRVNVLSMTPSAILAYCNILEKGKKKIDLQHLKYLISTGENLNKKTVDKFFENYDHISIINAYGLSECSDDIFHMKISPECKEIAIGSPIKNIKYCILDNNLNIVKNGEHGELYIGGDCLSRGYLNDSINNSKKYVNIINDRFFKTGDIVRENDSKEVFYIGRKDNQVKIRGHRIELEEIENHINLYEKINECVVNLIELKNEQLIIEALYTSNIDISYSEIKEYLEKNLPSYMIPSKFTRVETFMHNENGKIDRTKTTPSIQNEAFENTNELREDIFKTIIDNLDLEEFTNITINTDLSNVGIDSLSYAQIAAELEEKYDIELDGDFFLINLYPTIDALIDYIELKINNTHLRVKE